MSLGERESANTPQSFPVTSGSFSLRKTPLAAAYWSNVDLRCGGEVFYREENGSADTDVDMIKIKQIVMDSHLGSASSFIPKSAVIVTYFMVRPEIPDINSCISGEQVSLFIARYVQIYASVKICFIIKMRT